MKIRTRILLGYSPAVLILVASLAACISLWSAADRATRVLDAATEPLIRSAEQLPALVGEMNGVEYDYLPSFHPLPGHAPSEAAQAFDLNRRRFDSHLGILRSPLLDQESGTTLSRLSRAYADFLYYDGMMRSLIRQGQIKQAEKINVNESLKAYDRLFLASQDMLRDIRDLRHRTRLSAEARSEAQRRNAMLIALGDVVLFLLVGSFLAKTISAPLTEVQTDADRLKTGIFEMPAPSPSILRITEIRSLYETIAHSATELADTTRQLRAANANLESQIGERTADLVEAKHKLERTVEELHSLDRLKSSFVSTVSHELRTPLTTVAGFAEFLEDEIAGHLNEQQQGYVEGILAASNRLARLIDDLLDFARIDSGGFNLTMQRIDLTELLRLETNAFVSQATAQGIEITLQLPGESLLVEVDRDRIGQVVGNLVGNAIKFSPPGSQIQVSACQEGDDVKVRVRDAGIGISPQDQTHLFERFFQADPGNTRERGGLGLGLNISKVIIEAHQGHIGVISRLGSGSTFWFTLPLVSPDLACESTPLRSGGQARVVPHRDQG